MLYSRSLEHTLILDGGDVGILLFFYFSGTLQLKRVVARELGNKY